MSSPTIEAKLWRTDHNGNKLEDITTGMIQASVQMDPENDQTYTLDAIMEFDAYQPLLEYIDWVVPEITVTWPSGLVRKGRLGLYILIDPATVRGETHAYVHLRALDNLWLLSAQGFGTSQIDDSVRRRAFAGQRKTTFLRSLLESMVVSDFPYDHVRYAVPDTAATFVTNYEWSIEERKLAVANEVLEGMSCWSLWATKNGVLTSRERGDVMLRMQHPVRTYTANIPPDLTIASRLLPLGGAASEVVGDIRTSPGFDDLLNTVLIINQDPKGDASIYSERTVTDPTNRRAAMYTQQRQDRRRYYNKTIDDAGLAGQLGNGILDHLSTFNEIYEFDAVLDPEPEFAREVIDLLIWDALGRRVARSKALVHRVSYTFTPDEGVMTITAGRIDTAEGGLSPVAL